MRKRTEAEKASMLPIEVQFGRDKYSISPLPMRKSQAWREELVKYIEQILGGFEPPAENRPATEILGDFRSTISSALLAAPEKLADLVFLYATNLSKDEILEKASDEQIQEAFSGVFELAFPHLAELGRLTQIARAAAPASARYLN